MPALPKPKPSKNEKKARKAVLAHDLEEIPNIMRASFKRDENVCFYVQSPDVYKSKNSDIYVVFGVVRVDDMSQNNALQQAAAQKFQAEEPKEEPKKEEAAPAEPAAEEAVDETGLNPDDISFVMEQTQCTRAAAVKALRENDNDMINAVMALGK